jgi:inosose dehydratase
MDPILRRDFLAALAAAGLARAQSMPRIRVGCQTRAYGSPIRERDKLLAVLDDLVAAGYAGFETNNASVAYSFDNPAPLRAEIEKRGIALIGLHGSARLTDPALIEKERAEIDKLARVVKGLGGAYLILSGPGVPRDAEGRLNKDALKLRCAELNRAGSACRAIGVRLCTHNHAKEVANNGEEINAVMAGTNPADVSMLMDAAYVFGAGLNVPAFIRRHNRRIAGIHVRDMRDGKEVDMGTGQLDFAGIANALRETRWSGWVILEINKREGTSSRVLVERDRKYMRDVMKI